MSDQFKDITFEKGHYEAEPSTSSDRLIVIHTPQIQREVLHNQQLKFHKLLKMIMQIKLLMRNIKKMLNNLLIISARVIKSEIPDEFMVYLQESNYNIEA